MKPLPNLNDDAAMLLRGKRSAIGAARKEAAEALRDQVTILQGCSWEAIQHHAPAAISAIERLRTLAAMWEEL
jgi:heme oxygenase